MMKQIAPGVQLGASGREALSAIGTADDNLHALRRWIESAVIDVAPAGFVEDTHLRHAMVEDTGWLLSQIPYRGHVLATRELYGWVQQFPADLQPLAVHLVRQIAQKYYVSVNLFHEALDDLIGRSGIPRGSSVVFCRWQRLGESAERVAHSIKNQAGWRVQAELDLRQPLNSWPKLSAREARWFVVADDFIGSGRTACELFASPEKLIPRVLDRYPHSQAKVLVVAGFEGGIRRVRAEISGCRDRADIVVSRVWQDTDRCFDPSSRVLPDPKRRDRLRQFCLEAAERYMPRLALNLRLGYEETGGVVVFFDSVPNTSLPILWHGLGSWRPLFPRSGLPEPGV
jgi:hypothetical protein